MIHNVIRRSFVAPAVAAVVALCAGSAVAQGFTGPFAPSKWVIGSNPGGLVDTSAAPNSITLSNYPSWYSSGSGISYSQPHQAGTVYFKYSTSGTTSSCQATKLIGETGYAVLSASSGFDSIPLKANQKFGFALNGVPLAGKGSCMSDSYIKISFTISDLVFVPSTPPAPKPSDTSWFYPVNGFAGLFAPSQWNLISTVRKVTLVDTSAAPRSMTIFSYRQWEKSISGFAYGKKHPAGTVTFTYQTSNAMPGCPASYRIGSAPGVILPAKGSTVSFRVPQDSGFGFALNGQNRPGQNGCETSPTPSSPSVTTSFTVSDIQFTPDSGFAGNFAIQNWNTFGSRPGILDLSRLPDTLKMNGIQTDSIGGAKASVLFNKNHPAGTVTFTYSFLANYSPNCQAQYVVGSTKTVLEQGDPYLTKTFDVAENQPFGFALGGTPVYNNGCQVSTNQSAPYKISDFKFTPKP